jgi:starch-binding outer membrane protein SusE/F
MKYLSKILVAFTCIGFLAACEKDEKQVTLEQGTVPVLSSTVTSPSTLPMSFANKDNQVFRLNWTNPNYQFNIGASSQNVNYSLQMDTAGVSFGSANRINVGLVSDLSYTSTVGNLNDLLLNRLQLTAGRTYTLEIRVIASLPGNILPLTSNTLRYTVTPYAIPPKVDPPASGNLWVTGGATPASWMCGCPADLTNAAFTNQRFTRVNTTTFELTVNLTGGQSYLLIPNYGDWSDKYGYDGANNANNVDSDNFRRGGGDILAPATGRYKIVVDFQRGVFTLTRL